MSDETLAAPDSVGSTGRVREVARGESIGRYVCLRKLGEGGMGVVYAAFDPELDRQVAIKLMLTDGSDGTQIRTLREAQAMARLSHPNVVTVHDVGEHEGRVYLAMEYVQGETLRQWLAHPRRWQDVWQRLERVGFGLAAAHAKELIHRDVKPDNVMVGDDGRVRVMDFGLARSDRESEGMSIDAPTGPSTPALSSEVTRAGGAVGTPAYMAPEQHEGEAVGPAADQFSFCVTCWEALYGQRPFEGKTIHELVCNVMDGTRVEAPSSPVPAWLRRILIRGMSLRSGDRFGSMDELLAAVDKAKRKVRARRVGLLGGLALATVVGGVGYRSYAQAAIAAQCSASADSIAEVWNEQVFFELRDEFMAGGSPLAEATAAQVRPWLDDWTSEWQSARSKVCLEHELHGVFPEDLVDRSEACFAEHRLELEGLVEQLLAADDTIVLKAVQAAASLPQPGECQDARLLRARPVLTKAQRPEAQEIQRLLIQANLEQRAGHNEEALAVARAAKERASAMGNEHFLGAARTRLGDILETNGEYALAEEELLAAYLQSGGDDVEAEAAIGLVFVVGYDQARFAEGLVWAKAAKVAVERVEPEPGLRTADLLYYEATILNQTGSHARALELAQQAIDIEEHKLGPDHPTVAASLSVLANANEGLGDRRVALALHERTLKVTENTLGPDHPDVAYPLNAIANIHDAQGKPELATPLYERSLALREKALGSDHPSVGVALNNLASNQTGLGHTDRAKALFARATTVFVAALGEGHPFVGHSVNGQADVALQTGDYQAAIELAERAIEVRAAHPDQVGLLGASQFVLARALWSAAPPHQDRRRALEVARAALESLRADPNATSDAEETRTWLAEHGGVADPQSPF